MACKSNKKGYEKRKAQEVLNALLKNGKWNKKNKEGRIYPCPDCNMWHITSLKNESVDMRGMQITFKKRWENLLKNQNKEQ